MDDQILILGAGGFIGRHMLAGLSRAGFAVVAGTRRPLAAPASTTGATPAFEWRAVDAGDPASLRAALAGVRAVVNCVATEPAAMAAATRHLAAEAGSRRIVHLSSMAVYGAATGLVDEDAPLTPQGAYGESKAESERLLTAHAKAGGEVVMLRPGCVHGPGSESWTARPGRLLRAGRLGDLGPGGDGICNLTAVDDLVAATAAALRLPAAPGLVFNISDPAPGDWNSYFLALAQAIGATPLRRIAGRQMTIEKLAAYPLKVLEIAGRKARLRMPDPIPPSLQRVFQQDITLDHRRADAGLGFARTPPAAALAAAAAWFNAAG
ncbi:MULTISPECIES: NAD-dependent epimerase/dehydratase family protein [Roseomonadaceae]|uniref:NAD-dependent epimerase/dehydratase family protein n=1 Tax=Falsiroseomonas oleicola TaxID=2801474 RepID=A0ABS6H836_9PROT|nr:NAD-dependent epimerase/dehydratase family protein [Roseomonas oleicola]MBU8544869.1 NAD-dependent epimerase/dehydratase family protein [Roseomonas oleicola]